MSQYVIKAGDTLFDIAKANGTTVEAIDAANPGINASNLQVGEKINLSSSSKTTKYTIKAGDTLFEIAKAHNTTVKAIEAANPGIKADNLQVGHQINIPSAGGASSGGGSGGAGSHPGEGGKEVGQGYKAYSGPASNYPHPSTWASYDTLVSQNHRLMKFHDSDSEIQLIVKDVKTVANESGTDARVILCTIMQESGGDPRVVVTNNGVRNPGLMQSHNGVGWNANDPAGSILQMIRDGTEGTKDGDGLKQLYKRYGNYYEAMRDYNSGSVNQNDLNDPVGATPKYVEDIANRLMGHVWNNM
ncbi:hypothetical protein AAFC00_002795 [Neodothiora populina]|uniref:LysM domain-containing protein n=1 Tax=Neodothiora populina TaxID=2781224 RepID=A0ABR3P8F5_9PEZI